MNGAPSLLRGEGPPSQGWWGSRGPATAPLCRRGVQRGVSGSILSASAGSQGRLRVQTAQMSPGLSKEVVRAHIEQGWWAEGVRGRRLRTPRPPPRLRPRGGDVRGSASCPGLAGPVGRPGLLTQHQLPLRPKAAALTPSERRCV